MAPTQGHGPGLLLPDHRARGRRRASRRWHASPTTTRRLLAYDVGRIDTRQMHELENHSVQRLELHSPIEVTVQRWDADTGRVGHRARRTTVGRIIFNQVLPERLRFVNKTMDEGAARGRRASATACSAERDGTDLVDGIKAIGFEYATRGGITIAVDDITVPPAEAGAAQRPPTSRSRRSTSSSSAV